MRRSCAPESALVEGDPPELDKDQLRQLLCLYHNTTLGTDRILDLGKTLFDRSSMLSNGVRYDGVCAAGLDIPSLQRFGFDTIESFRSLGIDALDLSNEAVCTELVRIFGAASIIAEFVQSPGDAVALVGTRGSSVLGLTIERLLVVCAGCPSAASSIITHVGIRTFMQQPPSMEVLLDTGLRRDTLVRLGLSSVALIDKLGATTTHLRKLGYGANRI